MRLQRRLLALLLAPLLALAGCGTPGAPLPPSLQLPRPVDDLAAQRKGNRVILSWTPPAQTTDRQNIRHEGVTRICRSSGRLPVERCTTIDAELSPQQVAQLTVKSQKPKVVFEQPIPEDPSDFANFAVEVANERGRSAGLSNQVAVPTVRTLPAPDDVRAEVGANGVSIFWSGVTGGAAPKHPGVRYSYEVLRRSTKTPNFVAVLDIPLNGPQYSAVDKSSDWEQSYDYKIAGITHFNYGGKDIEVEGDDSPLLHVLVHDTFAPAQPTGVQAVFSGVGQKPFIDLSWAPNTESDLAGYNIYRREGAGAAVKLNKDLMKSPSFRDTQVQAGHTYTYSVSAVDLRNNESAKSEETSESVPQ